MKVVDMSGQVYGKLTVLKRAKGTRLGEASWECLCECGNTKVLAGSDIRKERIKSCGCLIGGRRRKELAGQKFGRLLVLKFVETPAHIKKSSALWECLCDCGNKIITGAGGLVGGSKKSCGCLPTEIVVARNKARATHKLTNSREYSTWAGMKTRCYNRKCSTYKNYGGRGITVCERWLHSFENFLSDMGEKPKGASIDRIDNDGDYSPENCRWASWEIQNTNKNQTGCYFNKSTKKWQAKICSDGKSMYLGEYPTKERAMRVYSRHKKIKLQRLVEEGV